MEDRLPWIAWPFFAGGGIAKFYPDDMLTQWLTNMVMGITIFISYLGLLGIAIFQTSVSIQLI
jgi:hypothetical protein